MKRRVPAAESASGEVRLLLVGPLAPIRDHVRRTLQHGPRMCLVAETRDGWAALEAVASLAPQVVIVDLDSHGMDAIALQQQIRDGHSPVATIFLTSSDDEERFEAALDAGVKGYLLGDCGRGEILRCIDSVLAGRHYVSPPMTSTIVRQHIAARLGARLAQLTPQEQAVLVRIGEHKSSKEIAAELHIAPRTVDTHRLSICKKLGVHGNYGLTRFASQYGGRRSRLD